MTGYETRGRGSGTVRRWLLALMLSGLFGTSAWAAGPDTWRSLTVSSFRGSGQLTLLTSRDWNMPQPDIVRAVITVHGERRDSEHYDAIAQAGLAKAGEAGRGTLLVTPRFGDAGPDATAAPERLVWDDNGWMDGGMATLPAALSSFDAMDAIIARLSDHSLFPAMRSIVLVGHSAGGQFVQRYAVLGQGEQHAAQAGITLSFVVANPSSYAYFSPDRPTAGGGFAPYPLDECHRFNQWKYGLEGLPIYAGDARAADLERDYVQRDVTYLLGALDTDPDLDALDKSCPAEAQGTTHLQRGRDFFHYLQLRHATGLRQHLFEIADVGHDATGMLTSECALAAIYDVPVCGHVPAPAAVAAPPTGQALPAATVRTPSAGAVSPAMPGSAPVLVPAPQGVHGPAPQVTYRPAPPVMHRPLPARRAEQRPLRTGAGTAGRPGAWEWTGEDYVWVPGRPVPRPERRSAFDPGHWRLERGSWIWVPEHWR